MSGPMKAEETSERSWFTCGPARGGLGGQPWLFFRIAPSPTGRLDSPSNRFAMVCGGMGSNLGRRFWHAPRRARPRHVMARLRQARVIEGSGEHSLSGRYSVTYHPDSVQMHVVSSAYIERLRELGGGPLARSSGVSFLPRPLIPRRRCRPRCSISMRS